MKNVEVPKWLQGLPLAPEFRPTDTEFADPIAYITKIEKEASSYGICKIIPPLPKPSKKFVFHNLNKSLSKSPELGSDASLDTSSKAEFCGRENRERIVSDGDGKAVFTTRSQELGTEKGKRLKGVAGDSSVGPQKQVWQSGEVYSLEQFEAKSRNFEKSQLGLVKEVNPLVIEAMFWKADSEKPIYVEYANDVPGSAFSEPEGLLQCFDRRRKKRRRRKRYSFDRNNLGNANGDRHQIDPLNKFVDNKDSFSQDNPNSCIQEAADYLPSDLPLSAASLPGLKDFQSNSEMEGTSGWKLSNSLWNLQVIARSQGSLTRFMPDDIPGVTSPMIYIGMLFSWFAWHVEDHELHSLNYLHVGSPKTWYSVPGHYASSFEEVIRLNAYGGHTDRFDSLSLLGEKTTVMSPEIILSSGIPCFRLVQYPGEFVVTFPRAYHIGFSHGFNCGEAANFGTPRWLDVAKEAAIRRAAMNYLPMLSHQQLLYLLTMSFISRVPRSLLPGVRMSRFRDRQKEERELLVKKAFVEDILHENNQLGYLLQRNSSYRAVLWNAESLPSLIKGSEVSKDSDIVSTGKECLQNVETLHDLVELNDFMSVIGSDLCNDDLSYDFQVESGALPCVACGVLGFPFMAVLQPSRIVSASPLLPDLDAVPVESSLPCDANHIDQNFMKDKPLKTAETSASIQTLLELSPLAVDNPLKLIHDDISSKSVMLEEWNLDNVSLKPRIFCLEHAIEVESLLSSKCRVNALVICHSDFQKIIAHAAAVAEEVAIPFRFDDVALENASPSDLTLIDIAIDTEEHDCAENWTSLLSINLQHLVNVKKSAQHENTRYLLSIGRLFSGETSMYNASSVNWKSRKLRTKKLLGRGKRCDGEKTASHPCSDKDTKIIQYSRKKYLASNVAGKLAALNSDVAETTIGSVCEVVDSRDDEGTTQTSAKGDKDVVVRGIPETNSEMFSENVSSDCSNRDSLRKCVPETEDDVVENKGKKRRREADELNDFAFIRSPCEGLRPRAKESRDSGANCETAIRVTDDSVNPHKNKKFKNQKGHHDCDIEDCTMSFNTKAELLLHKDDQCPVFGCRKRFNSHKYAIQHHKVHDNDRPLKCPWNGCTMSFKWAWARTEHLRVHTGERPYSCKVEGCGLTFRFISDFSRHRRKTGHSVK